MIPDWLNAPSDTTYSKDSKLYADCNRARHALATIATISTDSDTLFERIRVGLKSDNAKAWEAEAKAAGINITEFDRVTETLKIALSDKPKKTPKKIT